MAVSLYVGNLPYTVSGNDLRAAFTQFGNVTRSMIIMDHFKNRSKGFGFVEMEDGHEQAIETMNGAQFGGRTLKVNEAHPR